MRQKDKKNPKITNEYNYLFNFCHQRRQRRLRLKYLMFICIAHNKMRKNHQKNRI